MSRYPWLDKKEERENKEEARNEASRIYEELSDWNTSAQIVQIAKELRKMATGELTVPNSK